MRDFVALPFNCNGIDSVLPLPLNPRPRKGLTRPLAGGELHREVFWLLFGSAIMENECSR